jgi:adenosylcobinamide kinase/adenosylcobinamide-phosphate guanylyltransferase
MLTLILGGARSGKSKFAQRLAATASRVTYVATATAGEDVEMATRIDRHRADRPSTWQTIEEPLALADAVVLASKASDAILVDCLTIWLSNLFWAHRDCAEGHVEGAARGELRRIATTAYQCHVILVSNELGSGTVPDVALTRSFRDVQGLVNQYAAEVADEVILTVAGLPLYLKASTSQEGAR